ncbi:unnamed protein product [Boreogadus saida]
MPNYRGIEFCDGHAGSMVDESLIQSTPDIGKRKRDKDSDLLQYLERSDERHLQSLESSRVVTNNLLEQISASNTALLGLLGRVVTVMEAGQR